MAVETDAGTAGHMPASHLAGRRTEGKAVFGVDAAFDGGAFKNNVALLEAQTFACGDADLLGDDVNARHPFGHGVFNLHTGVHFDEIELAVFKQELKGTCSAIADIHTGFSATFADVATQFRGNARRRRFFDDFLVTTLHGAVAFAQIDGVLEVVREHLNFDVARIFQELFQIDLVRAECGIGLRLRHVDRGQQRSFGTHHAHAATAAARARLDEHGVADFAGNAKNFLRIIGQSTVAAWNAGNARIDHRLFGVDLVAHQTDRVAARADEGKAAFLDAIGKVGVFRQKAVTGVNGFSVRDFGCRNDSRDVEIALGGLSRADADAFVGKAHVHGISVGRRMHDDRLDAHGAAGPLNAQGDFPAICDKYFSEHGSGVRSRIIKRSQKAVGRIQPADRFRRGFP